MREETLESPYINTITRLIVISSYRFGTEINTVAEETPIDLLIARYNVFETLKNPECGLML